MYVSDNQPAHVVDMLLLKARKRTSLPEVLHVPSPARTGWAVRWRSAVCTEQRCSQLPASPDKLLTPKGSALMANDCSDDCNAAHERVRACRR